MSLPQITAQGRTGGDPETRFTPSGKSVTTFSLACDDRRKGASGQWETVGTTWLRVTVWDAAGEHVAETVGKGDLILVTGRLQVRDFDRNDGTKGTAVEVTADQVGVVRKAGTGHAAAVAEYRAADPGRAPADPWATSSAKGGETDAPF